LGGNGSKEVIIVGAGLSGLMAAIYLARNDHKVTILERQSRIGGLPVFRPDPAGSWFDIPAIERWTGVDISPAAKVVTDGYICAWGKQYDFPMETSILSYMVERGSRSTSIDTMLMEEAVALGVEIEFDHPVMTKDEFARLPRDTIIATGLHIETYEALSIPYETLHGWFAKSKVDHDKTIGTLWMDDYTKDYAFYCTINGVCFALLFQRDLPLKREGKKKFMDMLYEIEGVEFKDWDDLEGGACPVGSIRNPRLFKGDKILAGTLAGMIDPFLFFGMLGALVGGRISAMAIEDKREAYDTFTNTVRTFYPSYAAKRVFNRIPDSIKRPLVQHGLDAMPRYEDAATTYFARNIPGWRVLT